VRDALVWMWHGIVIPDWSEDLSCASRRNWSRSRGRLFYAEFFGVSIEHQALTCDEPNFQHGSRVFKFRTRDALNKGIAFEHCAPDGRKIISVSHQFGTVLREIV